MFRMIGAILLGGAAAFAPHAVAAQSWQPTKPITIVIPFPPGPGLDLVARMVAVLLKLSRSRWFLCRVRQFAFKSRRVREA